MVVHRVRVPHGNGEINLVVQVVDDRSGPHLEVSGTADDEATSLHQLAPRRAPTSSPQNFEGSDGEPRGFVIATGGRVGKYELKQQLGQGTFGLVFVARDTDLERDVAIKFLNPSHQTNADILHRFLQEAKASARIAHPGIITVLDCGKVTTVIGDSAYIVLELLTGESLTSRLARSGRLATTTAVEMTRQIASALDAAHRADVLHRDLKPDNVYLVSDPAVPSGERCKVLDFGLAKIGASKHTMMNTVFGTPRYMSPEQCRSATMIDHRSDIYSLGCMLFELVTGRTPFDGDLRQLIEKHQRATPPRAKSLVPEITQQLDDLIAQMLAKDPDQRPQTMGAVQAALYDHGAIAPGVAATMMPQRAMVASGVGPVARAAVTPHHGLPMPTPRQGLPMQGFAPAEPTLPNHSGMMLVPPHGPAPVPEVEAAPPRRKRRKAPFAAAAIAFLVAAALTAVAARGRTRSAVASPAPSGPGTAEIAPSPFAPTAE